MSKYIKIHIFCVGIAIYTVLVFTSLSIAFPIITAPKLYSGTVEHDSNKYMMNIYLLENNFFILHEKILFATGKQTNHETTGRWHQIKNGSVLHLANSSSLFKEINVGGAGALYVSLPFLAQKPRTISLYPQNSINFPLKLHTSGLLYYNNSVLVFKDTESDTEHIVNNNITNSKLLNIVAQKASSPIRVYAQYKIDKNNTILETSKASISTSKHKENFTIELDFSKETENNYWFFIESSNQKQISLRIKPSTNKSCGTITIKYNKKYIDGVYSLIDNKVEITLLDNNDAYIENILSIQKSQASFRWRLYGNVLELYNAEGKTIYFERGPLAIYAANNTSTSAFRSGTGK